MARRRGAGRRGHAPSTDATWPPPVPTAVEAWGGPTRRRRPRRGVVGVVAAALAVLAVAGVGGFAVLDRLCSTLTAPSIGAYAPAYARTAEWTGNFDSAYTPQQMTKVVDNASYFFVPKFAAGYDLQKQFTDIRTIVAKAAAKGNQIKVIAYFNASFWFPDNEQGWQPYSSTFEDSYLLHDRNGDTIPYWGLGNSQVDGVEPAAHQLDLTNPGYRAWAIRTLQAWVHDAPIDGVVFDSANPFIGDETIRRAIGAGTGTPNQLLCGADAPLDADGNCARVDAWNDGLSTLLHDATAALQSDGKEVFYNGVADNPKRVDRNTALLADTSGAANESFCYTPSLGKRDTVNFTPLADDISMMSSAAATGKKLFEITNYVSDSRLRYGGYCLGGFLMGWQPGSSFWVYHSTYHDTLADYPAVSEQNLNLGTPTGAAATSGGIMSRQFQRGFVAVNSGSGDGQVTVPFDVDQYRGGAKVASWTAGATVTLSGHDAAFFLRTNSDGPRSLVISGCRLVV